MNNIIESGKISKKPYILKNSKVKVYSIEEFLYSVKIDTVNVIEDFFEDSLKSWIKDEIGNFEIYNYLNSINSNNTDIVRYILNFIELNNYLMEDDVEKIKNELIKYNNSNEEERILKDIKFKIKSNNLINAYYMCKQYLKNNNSNKIMNELAHICVNPFINKYDEAVYYFLKLVKMNNQNEGYKLNLANAYLKVDKEESKYILNNMQISNLDNEHIETYYYLMGNITNDINWFKKSYYVNKSEKSMMNYINAMNKKQLFFESLKFLLQDEVKCKVDNSIELLSELLLLYVKTSDFINGDKVLNKILQNNSNIYSKYVLLKIAKYNRLKTNENNIEVLSNLVEDLKMDYIQNIF